MKRRGLSIIELLVTMALIVLMFDIAYRVLLPSLNIWMVNQAQAAIEDTSMVLEDRLVGELQRSMYQSVGHLPNPYPAVVPPAGPGLQAVSFATWGAVDGQDIADGYDFSTGVVTWYRYVIFYIPAGSQVVYRKVWPVGTPNANGKWPPQTPTLAKMFNYTFPTYQPHALTATDLQTLCTTVNGSEVEVASDVTRMQLTLTPQEYNKATGRAVVLPLNVQVRTDLQAAAPTVTHVVTTSRLQTVNMRN